jgi:hypothetical protein
MKAIELIWQGFWDLSEPASWTNIPETGGIIMLIDAEKTISKIGYDTASYRLIGFFETNNVHAMICPESIEEWKKWSSRHLLLKMACLESRNDRLEALRHLIGSKYASSEIVVLNQGLLLPLREQYGSLPQEESKLLAG